MYAPFVVMFMILKWVILITISQQELPLKTFPKIGCAHCVALAKTTLRFKIFNPNRSLEPEQILFYCRADCLSL